MNPEHRNSFPEKVALAGLLVLTVLFFWRVLFLGEVSITHNVFEDFPWKIQASPEQVERPSMNPDCVRSYYPRRFFATETIRSGEIPLWNPYDFSGAPFLANFQSAVFYPVNLALYLVDPLRAMGYYLFLHFLLAACFTLLLMRSLNAGVFAAFAAAVAVTLCGFLVTRTGHPTFAATASWVPGLFWCAERLFQRPSLRRAIWLGLCHAAMVLAGFPQIAFHATYALVLYTLYRGVIRRRSEGAGFWSPLLWVLAALAFSACVASVQIVSTYEFTRYSARRFHPYENILSSAHHPLFLIKYLVPDFFGQPLTKSVWSNWFQRGSGHFSLNYVSTTGYVGILPLLLAWVGLITRRRGAVFFAAMAGVVLLIVFGAPLLKVAYHFPGFNFSRIDRLIFLYMLAVGILAAFGIDAFDRTRLPRRGILIPIASAALVYWIAYSVVDLDPDRLYRAITPGHGVPPWGWEKVRWGAVKAGVLLSAGAALIGLRLWDRLAPTPFRACVLVLILIDLVPFGYRFNISRPYGDAFPPTAVTDRLRRDPEPVRIMRLYGEALPPNTASVYGIADAQGYNALTLDYYMELVELIQPGIALHRRIISLSRPESMESPIADLLSVEYFLTVGRPRPGGAPEAILIPNADALPRAFLVGRAELVPDDEARLERLSSPGFDPADVVYLTPRNGTSLPERRETAAEGASLGTARILTHGPNELSVEVEAEGDAWLVLAETYYPGWRAWVDENPTEVWRADHALRAVFVPKGRHLVRFRFSPVTFTAGAAASLAAVALGILGLVLTRPRKPEGVR